MGAPGWASSATTLRSIGCVGVCRDVCWKCEVRDDLPGSNAQGLEASALSVRELERQPIFKLIVKSFFVSKELMARVALFLPSEVAQSS